MAIRMKASKLRRGPLTDAEKEMHRQRMQGNDLGKANKPTQAQRAAASERMKLNNPMKNPIAVRKMRETMDKNHGSDFSSRLFKKLWAEGRLAGHPLSDRAKALSSSRMKDRNPMKDAATVEKMRASITPEQRMAASDRMKQTWAEGKITPAMFSGKGNVKGANQTERKLFPILRYYHGRFVGDGTFWLAKTTSGISRNPDFIFGSGKNKTALLVHGLYWHRDQETARIEMVDYTEAGWNLFVLWTKRLSDWMMPAVKQEIKLWLDEIASSQSPTPVLRQFMTWNANRTIILSPMES